MTGCSTSVGQSREPGGGFGWLDDDGVPEPGRPLELWITCRMTHVYALGHLLGRPDCAGLVDHGIAALRDLFHDDVNGGWFAQVGARRPRGHGQDRLRARVRGARRSQRDGGRPTRWA